MKRLTSVSVMLAMLLTFVMCSITPAQQVPALSEALINYSTSGDKTLVAGVSGQRVRVYRIYVFCNGANNILFKDTSATLSPVMNLSASQGLVFDLSTVPWYTTAVGSGFLINLSASQQCSGRIYYRVS